MLKTISVNHTDIEDHLYPNLYRFRKKINEYSERDDITSFVLGDEDVIDVLTDGEHAGQVFVDEGAIFIKNSCVKRYGISEFDGFYITHEKNSILPRSQLQKHDVLFTTIGKYLGVSAIVNERLIKANINQNVVRIRLNEGFTTPQYLSCFLNSRIARFQIDNLFTGNTHPILTYPKIKSLKIFIKDKKIEQTVTDNLLKAESLTTNSLQKIEEALNQLKIALAIDFDKIRQPLTYSVSGNSLYEEEMITPQFYNPLFVKTINEIQNKNKWDYLGTLSDFETGDEVGSKNYKLYLDRIENDISFIRTTDLFNYEIDRYPDFYVEREIYSDLDQQVEQNDILFTKDGKIGLTGMITESDKCILGSGILRIKANEEKIDPHYLFAVLSLPEVGLYQAKQRTVVASTLPHLRMDRMNDFVIPRVENEDFISSLIRDAFESKEEVKKLIDSSRLLIEKSLDWG